MGSIKCCVTNCLILPALKGYQYIFKKNCIIVFLEIELYGKKNVYVCATSMDEIMFHLTCKTNNDVVKSTMLIHHYLHFHRINFLTSNVLKNPDSKRSTPESFPVVIYP